VSAGKAREATDYEGAGFAGRLMVAAITIGF
jgi:hypothetical protein